MTNDEIRKKPEARNPKTRKLCERFLVLGFGFRPAWRDFGIRHSAFGFFTRAPCGHGPAHKPGRTGTRPARFWSQTKMPPRASGGGLVCRPGSAGKPWPASRQSGFSTWHAFYSSSFVVLMRAQLVAAAPDGQAGQKKLFGTPNPPGNWLSNPRRPVFALLRRGRPRNLRQDFYRTL